MPAGNEAVTVDPLGFTATKPAANVRTYGPALPPCRLYGPSGAPTGMSSQGCATVIPANVWAGVKRNQVERPSVPSRKEATAKARPRSTRAGEALCHSLVSTITTRPSASASTTMSTSSFQSTWLGHWLADRPWSRSQISE